MSRTSRQQDKPVMPRCPHAVSPGSGLSPVARRRRARTGGSRRQTAPVDDGPGAAPSVALASLAHDLRSPLAALLTALELLTDDAEALAKPHRRHLASTIHYGATWLYITAESWLARLSPSERPLTLDARPLDLSALFDKYQPLLQLVVAEREQPLEVNIERPLPLIVGDWLLISRAVMSLVSNASKYSAYQAPITLAVRRRAGYVRISVLDRGPGLPPDRRPLFQPFHRAPEAVQQGTEGTGLGLATVRAVAEAHGGRFGASNRPGGGACVWIDLPVAQSDGLDGAA